MNTNKVRNLIDNEIWNSTSINVVKLDSFKAAESALSNIKTKEEMNEFKEFLLAQTNESTAVKTPFIPRFLLSLCGKHPVDDRFIISVFDEYYKENRWDEVFYLGDKILSFNESPYIIKALAESYEMNNDEKNKILMWERLIKADHTETEVFYKLADFYEKKDEKQLALDCYKRAILRLINSSQFDEIKKVWEKIIKLDNADSNYLSQLAVRIASSMGKNLGEAFLISVLDTSGLDLNSKILVLKKILDFNNSNNFATNTIVALFREKYKDNPRLEYCLANTGLLYTYMNSNLAVQKFEKEIEFVENAFVWHSAWKLGKIKKIERDEIFIQFITKKELHKMSCEMAFMSLKVLPKQHIWVLKAGTSAQAIKEKLMSNIQWALKMIFNSFDRQLSLKQIKEELVPSILNENEWTVWQNMAKKELSSNPFFSVSDESAYIYVMKDTPVTFEEKKFKSFQSEKSFYSKYEVMKDFIKENGNVDSEEFVKMLSYFEHESDSDSVYALCAFIILDYYRKKLSMTFINTNKSFEEIYNNLSSDQKIELFCSIKDSELKHLYVDYVKENDPAWHNSLTLLLKISPSAQILDALSSASVSSTENNSNILSELITETVNNSQANPDLSIFFYKTYSDEDWRKMHYSDEEILTSKLSLLLYVCGKIEHNVDSQTNKIRQKNLVEDLFTKGKITAFLTKCETNQAKRIMSVVSNIPSLEESYSLGIKHFILANRKDADEIIVSDTPSLSEERIIPKGFLCTEKMYNTKKNELEYIMNVEIPENSKEIGAARDLGDLRENAEYQYAKDKQKNLNFMMNKLTDEIDIAKIVKESDVDTAYVEFGTKVTFTDNINNCEFVQTLFGPWESNPEKKILNFQAPLGQKIYNMKVGENKNFVINDIKYDLTVKKIELADFSLN